MLMDFNEILMNHQASIWLKLINLKIEEFFHCMVMEFVGWNHKKNTFHHESGLNQSDQTVISSGVILKNGNLSGEWTIDKIPRSVGDWMEYQWDNGC
jgi:hypothetical protein